MCQTPGSEPFPALPETTVGTPAQFQQAMTRPWEGSSEVELLAPREPLILDLLGAGEPAGLGSAAPVDADAIG